MCENCRRKTTKGFLKTVDKKGNCTTVKNEFCSMSQQNVTKLFPIICSHYKEFYSSQLININN